MIDRGKITHDWIAEASRKNNNADKILSEKVIHALLLVEGLAREKINFVFKGGTALMMLFGSAKRLSIDIDIVLPEKPDNLQEVFNRITAEQGFTRLEEAERMQVEKIDKEHYKFFYKPLLKTASEEDYILLDILYENICYKDIKRFPIESSFIPMTGVPLEVNIPSFEDLAGDKLTAFAPNTTGIPYFKKGLSMSMEIIKQLYDIGNLFDRAEDISTIKATFAEIAKKELTYRDLSLQTEKEVLEDIYQTSLCIVLRGADGNGDFDSLLTGIRRIRQFIFSENYFLDKAIISASKAAYLSILIKHDAGRIEKYSDPFQISNLLIDKPLNTKLNKLKKSNPEAFFYWYKIFEIEALKR